MLHSDAETFLENAQGVLRRIETYERSDPREIPRRDLQVAKREIEEMIECARNQSLPIKRAQDRTLTRLILDQWPLGHKLGLAISELEEEYTTLSSGG